MDCLCTNRKSKNDDIELSNHKKKIAQYWNNIKKITTEDKLDNGKNIQIECSYLLCGSIGNKPLTKQAICRNIPHYFCSEECWQEWTTDPRGLSKHDSFSPILSPLLLPTSPKYMKYFDIKNGGKINISKIPHLSI